MPKPCYATGFTRSHILLPLHHTLCASAYLCGVDDITGKNYEHRRQLIEDKILELPCVFVQDVCAYGVMSNHYHLVLHVNKETAENWSLDEVITQWHQLFKGNYLSQSYVQNKPLAASQRAALKQTVVQWRVQLMDISWFMRVLNEIIARASNKEDNCTG